MALYLAATTDKFSVITSAAATLDVHVSYADLSTSTFLPTGFGKQNTAITTATTTDVLASPAATTVRTAKFISIRNKHASTTTDMTFQFNQSGTLFELYKTALRPGDTLTYTEGVWFYYESQLSPVANRSIADQSVGASTTAYIVGSALTIPTSRPLAIGSVLKWHMIMSKTAAATVAMTFDVRFGTAGTTADTSRSGSLSTGTQTAAADVAQVDITAVVRGPLSASCLVHFGMDLKKNAGTIVGFTIIPTIALQVTSGAFDITTSGLIAGVSLTTGTSHAITIHQCDAEVIYP
jgi:hypothetical protein